MTKAICVVALDAAQAAGLAALVSSALESESPIADMMRKMGVDDLLRYIGPGGTYHPDEPDQCAEHNSVGLMQTVLGSRMPGQRSSGEPAVDPTDVVKDALKKAAESGTNVVSFPGKGKPPEDNDDKE